MKIIRLVLIYSFLFFGLNQNLFAQVIEEPDSVEVSEESEEGEEEAPEYDSVIVTGTDKYWDFIRPRNFFV